MEFQNDNYNIKIHKMKQEDVENLCNSALESCQLKSCQLYNPIMAQYMRFYNNKYSHNAFTFKTKYSILNIEKNRDVKNKRDTYKGIIGKNYDKNNNCVQWKDNVFVKMTPLLEVYPYMKNRYNLESKFPNIFNYLTTCKLNSTNNSGYLEAFCNMITSWLTESGKCPTFPYYYGTLTGFSESFKYDITEEFKGIRKTKWFKEYNNNLYTIEKKSIDDTLFDDLEEYDEEHMPHFSFDSSLDSTDFSMGHYLNKSSLKAEKLADLHDDYDDDDSDEPVVKMMKLDKDGIYEAETHTSSNDETETTEDDTNSDEVDEEESEATFEKSSGKSDSESDEVNEEESDDSQSSEDDQESKEDDQKIDNNDKLELSDISDIDEATFEKSSGKSNSEELKIIPGLDEDDFLMDDEYNVVIPDFPVQVICMESLDITLDEYVSKYKVSEEEWLSIVFQICFGLAVGQKHFALTHNDLHGNNVMFKKTGLRFLYYHYNGVYFQIPTFQKVTKIIDFTRSIFQVNEKLYFSDVFRKEGDAEGQYSYPYKNDLERCYHKPNKSFDLSRLATTISHYLKENGELHDLFLEWMTDKYGKNLGEEKDSFDLYVKIARGADNAVPKEQLSKPLFNIFHIDKEDIPDNAFIYYY